MTSKIEVLAVQIPSGDSEGEYTPCPSPQLLALREIRIPRLADAPLQASALYVCMSVYLCFLIRLLVIKLGSTLLQYDLDLITSAKPSFSNKVIF